MFLYLYLFLVGLFQFFQIASLQIITPGSAQTWVLLPLRAAAPPAGKPLPSLSRCSCLLFSSLGCQSRLAGQLFWTTAFCNSPTNYFLHRPFLFLLWFLRFFSSFFSTSSCELCPRSQTAPLLKQHHWQPRFCVSVCSSRLVVSPRRRSGQQLQAHRP